MGRQSSQKTDHGAAMFDNPRLNKGTAFKQAGCMAKQTNILETQLATAIQVAEYISHQGLATVDRPREIKPWIKAMLYKPEYAQGS